MFPALDSYFGDSSGVRTLSEPGIKKLAKFYRQNQPAIDSFQIDTIAFPGAGLTARRYTQAKIIDMYHFQRGFELSNGDNIGT